MLPEFRVFQAAVQKQFKRMQGLPLYRVALDKDKLWEKYLGAYPDGTNPIFRERTEHDCSACRHFVKTIGNIVAIEDGKLVSLWDFQVEGHYQVVADALAAFVKSHPIDNIFRHYESNVGTAKTFEETEVGARTWEHFHVQLPSTLVARGVDVGTLMSTAQAMEGKSLEELMAMVNGLT